MTLPHLTHKQILEWADEHHRRTGRWPISRAGRIVAAGDGTTWEAVNTALTKGGRGLPGNDSLSKLIKRRRNAPDARVVWHDLTKKRILEWIDDHYQRTGTWPMRDSGRVRRAKKLSWATVDDRLRTGTPSMPGGSSLTQLLLEARNVRHRRPALSEELIVKAAQRHRDRTGEWPITTSGPIDGCGDDWAAIDMALRHRRRGLPRRTSLSRLLTEHFGERYNPRLAPLTVEDILEWADRHHRRHGIWPTARSGPIPGTRDLKWSSIERALVHGTRGLKGGTTLAQFLNARRG